MNTGQMVARVEEIKQILKDVSKLKEEARLLNQLIALHDPLGEQESEPVSRNGYRKHPDHDNLDSRDRAKWARSERNRVSGSGSECKLCDPHTWHNGDNGIATHIRLSHPGYEWAAA